jgi:glucokinase
VTFSPNLVYDDPEIAAAVEARTGLPAFVDNDANAAAWGEFRLGSAKGAANLAFLTLGTGIGSGFVVDGRLLRGSTGAGAELGHIVIDPDGPQCPCGLRGCLEPMASGSGIARMAAEAIEADPSSGIASFVEGSSPDARDVSRAARELDETARAILRRAGTALGVGLSNVVNLFDPQVIVLGGGLSKAGEPYLGPARDRLAAMLSAQRRRPVRLDVSELGNTAGFLGAALLGMEAVEKT